jgi:hypothetical protein
MLDGNLPLAYSALGLDSGNSGLILFLSFLAPLNFPNLLFQCPIVPMSGFLYSLFDGLYSVTTESFPSLVIHTLRWATSSISSLSFGTT